jgi:hypothetical protein
MTLPRTIKLINILAISLAIISCIPEKTSKEVSSNTVPHATEFKPLGVTYTRKLHGQQVYVPIYSSIYSQHDKELLHMSAILSIRNTSLKEKITIKKIDYYDTNGKLLKRYINGDFALGKMSTKDFVINEKDVKGGTGANFIVEWSSDKEVSIPLIESVMTRRMGTLGFAFTSRGKEIEAH